MIWFALVLWAVLASAIATFAVHYVTRRKHTQQIRAYKDILHDRGIDVGSANEAEIKMKLKQEHQKETGGQSPSVRPIPAFARATLQRPKSKASWTSEASSTEHVGGHTRESLYPERK